MTTQNQPQTIAPIGDKQTAVRYLTAIKANAQKIAKHTAKRDDELAKVNAKYAERIDPLQELNDSLKKAVETWCNANKDSLLTTDSKTVQLGVAEISWRLGKPSVVADVTPELFAKLERFGLDRFVRVKKELDKTAILKEPTAIDGIEGIDIKPATDELTIRL